MPTTTPTSKRRRATGKVIYPANYGDATVADVTRAVLRYRPSKRVTATEVVAEFNPTV